MIYIAGNIKGCYYFGARNYKMLYKENTLIVLIKM